MRQLSLQAHGLRTYVHISTGNYNPSTASTYTDLGVLSCDPQLGEDVVDMFKFLTGIHLQKAVGGFRKLLVGNQYMKGQLLQLIDNEIVAAKHGERAAICIKVCFVATTRQHLLPVLAMPLLPI
jgi:polyphosphate kinase